MATRRDPRAAEGADRPGLSEIRRGYTLPEGVTVLDVLADDAELLRSEGIDPAWPPPDDLWAA